MSEVYPMIPAASKAMWACAAIGLLMLGIAGALGATAWAASHTLVRVSERGLSIEGAPFFGRSLAWHELDVAAAEIVSLGRSSSSSSPYRPARRTLGTGLPGYSAGWFRLASGEKALAFVTRGDTAVRIPTRHGWVLLMTVERPEELLARIQLEKSDHQPGGLSPK